MRGEKNMATGTEGFAAQVAAQVWGHRFMDGQRGPEYVLEFLNVLVGADYRLNSDKYKREKAEGFRKFIFEGDKEGSKNGIVKLEENKKEKLYEIIGDKDRVAVVREFFRNLEVPLYDGKGNLANRSWYAKSLYPLHESLLFFELRKKGENVSYERNFFARGGELYYLMLSYGTEHARDIRGEIQNRMRELLQKNKPISNIVKKMKEILDGDVETKDSDYGLLKKDPNTKREYPELPVTDHPLFPEFAKEFHQLIHLKLEINEMFHLLVSLVCFQLARYMYDRTKQCIDDRVLMFVDCMDGQVSQILKLSAQSFQQNEIMIQQMFNRMIKEQFIMKIKEIEEQIGGLEQWRQNPKQFFEYVGFGKTKNGKQRIEKLLNMCKSVDDFVDQAADVVQEIVSSQLKKHQLAVVRGVIRDGGMGGFRVGTNYRYFMTDKFVEMLVLTNVEPQCSVEFSEFLSLIYTKYGFVIGEEQAKISGLYEQSRLNISYFQRNENALREKLKKNGLLIEYSDATAMIKNPYQSIKEKVIL
ncbi:hypothetical protein JEG43_03280 [Anoxybacillus sp. LAT_35]|nr:hypothetical protein [Anoxybacillus sp. LAT_11]MCG6174384.1 hypothetical protein [Anoxybacillus sp. LAT_31]MCG6177080.1 hypothetical protein [Anoxybacillus sp. LAT_35]MCG6179759.1 hypothetical protein [Anoxybacillus sp. LAT_33]